MALKSCTHTFKKLSVSFSALVMSAGLVLASAQMASANPASFVQSLWPEAQAKGVSRQVFDAALSGFKPSEKVMSATSSQAELVETVGQYIDKRVSAARISNGRSMRGEWNQTLGRVYQTYGVQPEIVLAIWGMETNYGSFMGGNNVIHALATLTYNNYRRDFFKNELLTALQILQQGHVSPQNMVGSWAGAMGHTQFMPSSFTRFAVDYNGDGRRDIWNNVQDALASTGNYLNKNGWRAGETWGYEVQLPQNFDFSRAWSVGKQSVAQWQAMGVRRVGGRDFPRSGDTARIFMPAGGSGPVFLLLHNFDVIKRYNNSDNYALSVGHLADRILGTNGFVQPWPSNDAALNKAQRIELQNLLNRRGYSVGTADGIIGSKTREAVIAFQRSIGVRPDGYANSAILQRLR